MEAATASGLPDSRELSGDKATRIVEAMRASVAERGFDASTFDQVAGAAGVSRGLLHYYFGTKERLLVEAVRRESQLRLQQLDRAMTDANSADEVLAGLVHTFEEIIGEGPSPSVMFFEVLTLAQRNDEIAAQLAELGARPSARSSPMRCDGRRRRACSSCGPTPTRPRRSCSRSPTGSRSGC